MANPDSYDTPFIVLTLDEAQTMLTVYQGVVDPWGGDGALFSKEEVALRDKLTKFIGML
jgi:hypothetical protein